MTGNLEIKSIKIVLLGDTMVGKNSICDTYVCGESILHDTCQIGGNKSELKIKLKNGKEIGLVIWTTNGQERFRSLALGRAKYAHGVIIVFSVIDKKSFDNIPSWINQLDEIGIKNYVIFGNKIDFPENEWKIKTEEAKKFAQENNIAYFETSCKTREGLEEGFSYLANELYENLSNENSNKINLTKKEIRHESNCASKKNKK